MEHWQLTLPRNLPFRYFRPVSGSLRKSGMSTLISGLLRAILKGREGVAGSKLEEVTKGGQRDERWHWRTESVAGGCESAEV